MCLIVLYFLHSTSVLSFYIDVVVTLSMCVCVGGGGGGGTSYRPHPSKTIPLQAEITEHTFVSLPSPPPPSLSFPPSIPYYHHDITKLTNLSVSTIFQLPDTSYICYYHSVLHSILYESKGSGPSVFHCRTPLSSNHISNMSHPIYPPTILMWYMVLLHPYMSSALMP